MRLDISGRTEKKLVERHVHLPFIDVAQLGQLTPDIFITILNVFFRRVAEAASIAVALLD